MRKFTLLFLAILSVAVSLTRSQDADPPSSLLRVAGEEAPIVVSETWDIFKDANRGLVGGVAQRSVSYEEAIRKAHALVGEARKKEAKAQLERKYPKTDLRLVCRLGALQSVAAGQPDQALLLLTLLSDLQPDDNENIFNLAGLLAGSGYPNEALALLDRLEKEQKVPLQPLGLAPQDAGNYLRAYCEVRLGSGVAARKRLETLQKREPVLSEASKLLALLDDEEDKNPRRNFIASLWRKNLPKTVCGGFDPSGPDPDPNQEGEQVAIDVRGFLDLAKGKPGKLPAVSYAPNAESTKAVLERNDRLSRSASAYADALYAQLEQLRPAGYDHSNDDVKMVWGHQMEELLISLSYRDATLRELDRKITEADREAQKTVDEKKTTLSDLASKTINTLMAERAKAKLPPPTFVEFGTIEKEFADAALSGTHGAIERREAALRNYFEEWHRLATAVVARVGHAKWREVLRLRIEVERQKFYLRLIACSTQHAHAGNFAFVGAKPGPEQEGPEEQEAEDCDGDKSLSLNVNKTGFGEVVPFDFGIEVTCDGISFEGGTDIGPMLSLSGEIGVNKEGNVTVFVGPKFDPTFKGRGAAVKEGFYVSANKDGVTDYGLKMEAKTHTDRGPISVATKVGEAAISFMPAPQSPASPGLPDFDAR